MIPEYCFRKHENENEKFSKFMGIGASDHAAAYDTGRTGDRG